VVNSDQLLPGEYQQVGMVGERRMKIAYVYDAVYPWQKGGAQKRIWELARRLSDDHDVHFYGMHYWDGPSVIKRDGVTLHGVCEPYELYTGGRRSIPQALAFTAHVAHALLREEFHIVDCQEFPYFPCFVAKAHEFLWKSTCVVTWYEVWDDYWYEYLGRKGLLGKAIERTTIRLPRDVIAISEHIRGDLRRIGRDSGVSVVPNGVDCDGIHSTPVADADWDVLYVGRLSEHKNLNLLLEAVERVSEMLNRPITCGIIGDGPERDALERDAESASIDDQVTFLGFVETDEEVIGHMKAANLFVLPSTREGFPNTILEANACGTPSVVVNHPENGARAIVEDGTTGFVTKPTAMGVADAIGRVLTDGDLRADLSANAREFAEEHNWERIADRLERVYAEAINR